MLSKNAGILSKNWYVFKFNNSTPWPNLSEEELLENTLQYGTGICICKKIDFGKDNLDNIPIGKILIATNRSEACRILNFNEKSLRTNIINSKKNLYRGWCFSLDNKPIKTLLENINILMKE